MDEKLNKAVETVRDFVIEKGTQEQKEAFDIMMEVVSSHL